MKKRKRAPGGGRKRRDGKNLRVALGVRFSLALRDRLKAAAAASGLSVTQEIENRLWSTFRTAQENKEIAALEKRLQQVKEACP